MVVAKEVLGLVKEDQEMEDVGEGLMLMLLAKEIFQQQTLHKDMMGPPEVALLLHHVAAAVDQDSLLQDTMEVMEKLLA
jgi:hypothetical protein